MISHIYANLLTMTQDAVRLSWRGKWELDVGEVDGERWEVALSSSQKLSQLFILSSI